MTVEGHSFALRKDMRAELLKSESNVKCDRVREICGPWMRSAFSTIFTQVRKYHCLIDFKTDKFVHCEDLYFHLRLYCSFIYLYGIIMLLTL